MDLMDQFSKMDRDQTVYSSQPQCGQLPNVLQTGAFLHGFLPQDGKRWFATCFSEQVNLPLMISQLVQTIKAFVAIPVTARDETVESFLGWEMNLEVPP